MVKFILQTEITYTTTLYALKFCICENYGQLNAHVFCANQPAVHPTFIIRKSDNSTFYTMTVMSSFHKCGLGHTSRLGISCQTLNNHWWLALQHEK
jgi:hypothetical protein